MRYSRRSTNSIPGSAAYIGKVLNDVQAVSKYFRDAASSDRPPSLFLTFSQNDVWPELQRWASTATRAADDTEWLELFASLDHNAFEETLRGTSGDPLRPFRELLRVPAPDTIGRPSLSAQQSLVHRAFPITDRPLESIIVFWQRFNLALRLILEYEALGPVEHMFWRVEY